MKRSVSLVVSAWVLLLATASGQMMSDPFASAFTSAASDSVRFNFDVSDTLVAMGPITCSALYRAQSTTSWTTTPMTELYQSCSLYTFGTSIEYSTSLSTAEWYIRAEADSAVATQSPKNASGQFPVPQYQLADVGVDPVGDAVTAAGTFQDITHAYASYSDTKLFVRIDNNGGGFPTNSGLTFYMYAVGVVDPDVADSVAFSMVYVNIPFVMTSGLYKFDPSDSSFSRIGNISTNISGTSLSMSCSIADLTAQPEWSDWPPPSGVVILAPITATLSGSTFDMTTNDWGKIAIYQPASTITDYSSNVAPVLSLADVNASTPGEVNAQVTYGDADDNLPVTRDFHFELSVYPMTACEKEYSTATLFECNSTVTSSGWYRYFFEFSDGAASVTTDLDSIYINLGQYVPGDADGSGIVDIDDVVYLITFIFASGPAPEPYESGDVDCSGMIDIDDVVYLITYIFQSGPPPLSC